MKRLFTAVLIAFGLLGFFLWTGAAAVKAQWCPYCDLTGQNSKCKTDQYGNTTCECGGNDGACFAKCPGGYYPCNQAGGCCKTSGGGGGCVCGSYKITDCAKADNCPKSGLGNFCGYDKNGNKKYYCTRTFCNTCPSCDTTAPSNVAVTAVSPTRATVTWMPGANGVSQSVYAGTDKTKVEQNCPANCVKPAGQPLKGRSEKTLHHHFTTLIVTTSLFTTSPFAFTPSAQKRCSPSVNCHQV